MTRTDILTKAGNCVSGAREGQYGSPEDSFKLIAGFWSHYLNARQPLGELIELHGADVAAMMALLKIARIAGPNPKSDNWIDLAGYAACGGEIESHNRDIEYNEEGETMKGFVIVGYPGIEMNHLKGQSDCVYVAMKNFASMNTYARAALELANALGVAVFIDYSDEVIGTLKTTELPRNVGDAVVFCPRSDWAAEWAEKESVSLSPEQICRDIRNLLNCGLTVYQPRDMEYDLVKWVETMRETYSVKIEPKD